MAETATETATETAGPEIPATLARFVPLSDLRQAVATLTQQAEQARRQLESAQTKVAQINPDLRDEAKAAQRHEIVSQTINSNAQALANLAAAHEALEAQRRYWTAAAVLRRATFASDPVAHATVAGYWQTRLERASDDTLVEHAIDAAAAHDLARAEVILSEAQHRYVPGKGKVVDAVQRALQQIPMPEVDDARRLLDEAGYALDATRAVRDSLRSGHPTRGVNRMRMARAAGGGQ